MYQIPEMTRRVFLNRTLQALGAVAALPLAAGATGTGSLATAGPSATAATAPASRFLTAEQFAALDAITDTLIPHGGAFELGARDVGLAARIDTYLQKFEPHLAQGFRGALVFVEQKAPALASKTAPFSGLSEDDRAVVCEAMVKAGGLPAGVFLAMKYITMGHFYTMDVTWKFTGYDGPMLMEGSR
jgi:hypothetical protein